LSVLLTVSRETPSTAPSSTIRSARSRRVQLARPSGGSEQDSATKRASARPSRTRLRGLPGFLAISATSSPSSTKRRLSRATVSALVSIASAILSSVQAGPPSEASALSRMRAYSSDRACAPPRRISFSTRRRSSSVRRTTYLLYTADLPKGVGCPRGYAEALHRATEVCQRSSSRRTARAA
jgi:hypothetical protein